MHFYIRNLVFLSGILVSLSSTFVSCDRSYSNYLAENAGSPEIKALSTEYAINLYADSIDALLPSCKVERSMLYSRGDYSFRVSRYSHKGRTVLYIEHGDSGEYGNTDKRYYIKDNSAALLIEKAYLATASKPYSFSKIYFQNGAVFYAKQISSVNKDGILKSGFRDIQYSGYDPSCLALFDDALSQKGEFDLDFEGIVECSKAKYLIFSKDEFNSYRAPVKIEATDEFISELSSNPQRYKGEKLEIVWGLSDSNEVVYANGKLKNRD